MPKLVLDSIQLRVFMMRMMRPRRANRWLARGQVTNPRQALRFDDFVNPRVPCRLAQVSRQLAQMIRLWEEVLRFEQFGRALELPARFAQRRDRWHVVRRVVLLVLAVHFLVRLDAEVRVLRITGRLILEATQDVQERGPRGSPGITLVGGAVGLAFLEHGAIEHALVHVLHELQNHFRRIGRLHAERFSRWPSGK